MKFLKQIQVGDSPNYTLPLSDGTNGQVLTTDGSGNISFSSIPAASIDFDDLTNKESGTGDYATTGDFTSGEMALTTNDGYGKSNMTFNHKNGTPQVDGASARITFNTQPTGALAMQFQMANNVTTGTPVSLTSQMILAEEYLKIREYLSHQGDDNTYVRFTTDRVRIGAGGTVVFDSNSSYDNYGSWNLKTGGVQRTTVTSGGDLDIVGGTNISVSYSAGGVVTINNDNDPYNNWTLNGDSILDGVAVTLPIAYASGAGTPADPAVYYNSLTASNGLTFTPSTNTIELDEDLIGHVQTIGMGNDYHNYNASGQVRTFVNVTGSAVEQLRIVSNDAHFKGDVIAFSSTLSDARLKDDVKTIENASDKVSRLRGVEYTWNKGSRLGQREIGLIAQEVESVVPSIVKEKEMHLLDGETYKTVDYEKLVALLIESNKEQQEIISQLEERIIDIENRL